MSLQTITANRLRDGRVVFLRPEGGWSERVTEARIAADEATAQAMTAAAEGAVAAREVVGPYLIEVIEAGGGPRPARLKERIRAGGPTVPSDFSHRAAAE
jgi:hypothetical protein